MPCEEHDLRVGDKGTVIEITLENCGVPADISGASTIEVHLHTPSDVTKTKTGVLKTDGTDGIIQYTTTATDLNSAGIWTIQAHIITPSGEWHSSKQEFEVHDNF